MPLLRDARRERFAQLVASGIPYTKSYVQAGYKPGEAAAWRCRSRADVSARIDEIMGAAAAKNDVTVERVVAELAKIGFASADDFFDWGPDGVTIRDKSDLTPEQRAVVSEVMEQPGEFGSTIKIKLYDKPGALEKLGRYLGMFREKVELDANLNVKDVSPRERIASRIAGLAARSGAGGGSS